MMFVGFLGCYGAIQESQCLLGTFFTCLVILFACEVAAGIWGFVNKDQIAKDVKQFYDQAFQQALMAESETNNGRAVVKTFHETLDCCGPDNAIAAVTPLWREDLCPKKDSLLKTVFEASSCHKKIDELFSGKLYLIGIAAIVVAVIMVSVTARCPAVVGRGEVTSGCPGSVPPGKDLSLSSGCPCGLCGETAGFTVPPGGQEVRAGAWQAQ
uniref:CD81 molecule n=1 Tax=Calidris pygmaea TaxID=425635 RepID=A0A8C3KED9_9CHAR